MGCLVEGDWLCTACREQLPAAALTCIGCDRAQIGGRTCRRCRKNTDLQGVVSAGPYTSPLLRRGVGWLKFNGVQTCAHSLAELAADKLAVIAPPSLLRREAVLIPIPLHRRRQRERGFNQSLALAQSLSARAGIRVAELLARSRFTWTQTRLPLGLRSDNTAGAFQAAAAPQANELLAAARWLLIVDDVTTTGSTLSAAAAALRPHVSEAAEIWGVTVARG
jgi:ComF family protein